MDGLAPFLGLTWVEARQTIGEAARAVVRGQLSAILAKRDGTLAGEDPEELHQMRVACRRLRTAIGLFREHLPDSAERLREEAGWLGSVLGPVRDADVQLEALRREQPSLPEGMQDGVDAFLGWIAAGRREAFQRLESELTSDRWRRFAAEAPSALPPETSPAGPPVIEAGAEVIRRRYRKVRRLVRSLEPSLPDERFHEARIAAKKARYAMEFLAPVFGADCRACAKRLAELQEHLGALQDRAVARAWIWQARQDLGDHLFALGFLAGWCEADARQLKGGVRARWKPVRDAWRRLRTILPEPRNGPLNEGPGSV
ncbi:MAG: CHAD domain-containing protein [Fimbriimonadales bacterium]